MSWVPGVRGVLFDVDGTLLLDDRPIAGAPEVLDRLRTRGIPFRMMTNTSRRPRSAVASVLRTGGFKVEDREILAPCVLARRRILDSGRPRAAFLLPESAREDFEGVVEDESRPDWLVVGDVGRDFTWERLNRAYHWIQGGAALLALHMNRVWDNGSDGVVLDAGPFVAALEYAAGVTAEIVGKPARPFFELALADLGLKAGDVMVVGDDLEADCRGGARAGLRTVLVLSGKTTRADLERSDVRPDRACESVRELSPES
jgi:phospholysine phosphohistidine inorganic pyrophosphate phosphatase